MNQLVLSGTATIVLSGTRSSCYRGPESDLRACFSALSRRSNFTNQKSFGFLLTDQTATCMTRDRQRRAAAHADLHRPLTHFTAPKARGFQLERWGAAA